MAKTKNQITAIKYDIVTRDRDCHAHLWGLYFLKEKSTQKSRYFSVHLSILNLPLTKLNQAISTSYRLGLPW